jgi:hypothetical protein
MIPARPDRPTLEELRRSWVVTTGFLEAARQEVAPQMLAEYEECISHNELELALDELEQIGEDSAVTQSFWHNLISAAENMGLSANAVRFRRKLNKAKE